MSHGHSHMHERQTHGSRAHDPHAHGAPANERKLAVVVVLTGGFMLAEVAGGIVSGSLALLADAGHMLTDFSSLALAWFAIRISKRPADWKRSYGFDRFSVLAAFVNGLALFVIAAWIFYEAFERLRAPGEVLGGLMFWVALAGLLVNLIAFRILTRGGGGNLNIRAAALHVMGDLLGSVGAVAAAVVIMTTGWTPADPLISVFVALVILRSAWSVVKESGHILLEGAPAHLDRRRIADALTADVAGVARVDHVHAWSITEERPMITMEVEIKDGSERDATRRAVKDYLRERFGVSHATIEIIEPR